MIQLKFDDLSQIERLTDALEQAIKLSYSPKNKADYEYLRRQIVMQTAKSNLFSPRIQTRSQSGSILNLGTTQILDKYEQIVNLCFEQTKGIVVEMLRSEFNAD